MRRASGQFDVLVTMDQNLPFQQNLTTTTLGVVLVRAPSNRLIHVRPLVHGILAAMVDIQPGEMRQIVGERLRGQKEANLPRGRRAPGP